MGPYEYKPLKKNEIRILHLQPGEENDSVSVEISHEELVPDMEEYTALSWQWGDENAVHPIRIKDKDSPTIWNLEIRKNLLAALKQLRKSDKILRLWVDAVCIKQEQENNSEKSIQISLMTKIYGMAHEVSVWLGEASDRSDRALEFVGKLGNLDDQNHIAGLDRTTFDIDWARDLEALIKLLKRGWFSRRWVVQEIAMARHATLHCGKDVLDWTKLADAIALLEKFGRDGRINRELKKLTTTGHTAEYVGSFSSLPAYRLVQNTTGMFRGQNKKDIQTWRYTLEELVSFLAAFRASRLHDTIYALLGLSSDVKPGAIKSTWPQSAIDQDAAATAAATAAANANTSTTSLGDSPGIFRRVATNFTKGDALATIEVNYAKPPLEVFKEFLNHAIDRSQSLDIICRPWAPDSGVDALGEPEHIDLPSWIPSLSRKPFQPTRHGDMVRYNPDPLVGPASFRHKFYSASGLVKPKYKFPTQSPAYLHVDGFELGKVGKAWDTARFGNVPAEWLSAGGWENDKDPPPDELWRALVADRNSQGDDPDRWYPMVFQSAAKDRGIMYGFETHRLIHESSNAMVAELFRRVQAVVWNRKLMRMYGGSTVWLKEDKGVEETKGGGDDGCLGENGGGEVDTDEEKDDGVNGVNGDGSGVGLRDPVLEAEEEGKDQGGGALGLAPSEAQIGDIVCIIFGCSVPLVLRKVSGPGEPERYTLIGECYVDHMMDGEAMTYFAEKLKKQERTFLLE